MVSDILPDFFLANHSFSGGVVHCGQVACYNKYSHSRSIFKQLIRLHSCLQTVEGGGSTRRGRGHKEAEKPLRRLNPQPSCPEAWWLLIGLHVFLHGNSYQVWVELVSVVQSWWDGTVTHAENTYSSLDHSIFLFYLPPPFFPPSHFSLLSYF